MMQMPRGSRGRVSTFRGSSTGKRHACASHDAGVLGGRACDTTTLVAGTGRGGAFLLSMQQSGAAVIPPDNSA